MFPHALVVIQSHRLNEIPAFKNTLSPMVTRKIKDEIGAHNLLNLPQLKVGMSGPPRLTTSHQCTIVPRKGEKPNKNPP